VDFFKFFLSIIVFEILVNVSKNMAWDKAMLDVIAPRKMAKPKEELKKEQTSP
jgi:hypothetical protein